VSDASGLALILAFRRTMNNLVKWEHYAPYSIGFEDMFRRLDNFAANPQTYPPYNLVKLDDEKQQLQVALAGFDRDDIEVSVEKKVLNICVTTAVNTDQEYVHKGIAARSFSRNWQLSQDTIVDGVEFVNGLLCVTLKREVPEEDKKRILPIS